MAGQTDIRKMEKRLKVSFEIPSLTWTHFESIFVRAKSLIKINRGSNWPTFKTQLKRKIAVDVFNKLYVNPDKMLKG